MERTIKQKIDTFSLDFKNSIKDWLKVHNVIDEDGNDKTHEFIQYIFDYETLVLEQDDFKKRKRIKNQIPNYDRCCALRSNHERCTRKKKKDCNFCGTHNKGTPYGTVDDIGKLNKVTKISIWLEEINGIHQYIDENNNVYSTEDMNSGINPPRVISNWIKDSSGKYKIK
jgi:hypothetical protein